MPMYTTLVTGASKGIGLEIAKRAAADGHNVIGIARSKLDQPFPGEYHQIDLEDAEKATQTLDDLLRNTPVDNLVNNAGYPIPQSVWETSLENFDKQIAVNLRAALICTKACLPAMQEKKRGRIVNISSRAILGKTERSAYAAAKSGLVGFTRVWALELAAYGITVNAIAPGPIATELFLEHNVPGTEKYDAIARTVPVKRMGRPEDVTAAVAFLISDQASFITGQLLHVCGGMSLSAAPV
jgi:3-oxoacyl-[acyl-carrier protein] reductase